MSYNIIHNDCSNSINYSVFIQCYFTATRPRPGATIILSSNGAILPPYSQLSITQLSSTSGLQCNGDTGASSAMWMLPDASSLEENSSSINGLQVRRITSVSNPNVELLITGTDPISTTGVFWCIVKYDNYVDMFPIWIVMDSCKQAR